MTKKNDSSWWIVGVVLIVVVGFIKWSSSRTNGTNNFDPQVPFVATGLLDTRTLVEQNVRTLNEDRPYLSPQDFDRAKSIYDQAEREFNSGIQGLIESLKADNSTQASQFVAQLEAARGRANDFVSAVDQLHRVTQQGPQPQNAPPIGGGAGSGGFSPALIEPIGKLLMATIEAHQKAQKARRDEILQTLNDLKWQPFQSVN